MSTWNGKYISIKSIVERAYRDTGGILKIDYYDAIEWAGEAIELIGSPIQLLDKHECLEIEEYKAKLPCELHLLMGVRIKGSGISLRYSTDLYHSALVCQDINHGCTSDITYTINDDYIFTTFEEGDLEIVYKAIPTDDEGFPLVPDDIKFVKAVKSYIEERIFWKGLLTGKVQNYVHQKADIERDWYIGAAQNRGNMPSPDMMESLKNNWIRLIKKIDQHSDGFKSIGQEEIRNKGNTKENHGNNDDLNSTTYTYIG